MEIHLKINLPDPTHEAIRKTGAKEVLKWAKRGQYRPDEEWERIGGVWLQDFSLVFYNYDYDNGPLHIWCSICSTVITGAVFKVREGEKGKGYCLCPDCTCGYASALETYRHPRLAKRLRDRMIEAIENAQALNSP